jgi:hypothetical protein
MSTQPIFNDRTMTWSRPADRVDCAVDGRIVQLPVAELECLTGGYENEDEWCRWIEYRRPGEPSSSPALHRSARTHVKKGLDLGIAAHNFA